MSLTDLKGDGDHKLIVIDLLHNFANKNKNFGLTSRAKGVEQRKLKIYQGTQVIYETMTPEKPVALATFFDSN